MPRIPAPIIQDLLKIAMRLGYPVLKRTIGLFTKGIPADITVGRLSPRTLRGTRLDPEEQFGMVVKRYGLPSYDTATRLRRKAGEAWNIKDVIPDADKVRYALQQIEGIAGIAPSGFNVKERNIQVKRSKDIIELVQLLRALNKLNQ